MQKMVPMLSEPRFAMWDGDKIKMKIPKISEPRSHQILADPVVLSR